MSIDYRAALRAMADLDPDAQVHHEVPWPTRRPVISQPPPQTDGLDPAAPGGPAPYNSAQGPYGVPVTEDPMLDRPIHPGQPVPHQQGPDVDTTTLR
jgi:hypothetical protein